MKPTYDPLATRAKSRELSANTTRHEKPEHPGLMAFDTKRNGTGEYQMPKAKRSVFKDNGLTIALAILFLLSLIGMIAAGFAHHNEELLRHRQASVSLISFITGGNFLSALFENWESEFLQMGVYVVLTAWLFQRGSAESKDPDEELNSAENKHSRTGFFYRHSLGIALFLLFILCFGLHTAGSFRAAVVEAAAHGETAGDYWSYLLDAGLWFESFQNWQSEFLSTAVLVVLSIYLREKGSPESKPVDATNEATGG